MTRTRTWESAFLDTASPYSDFWHFYANFLHCSEEEYSPIPRELGMELLVFFIIPWSNLAHLVCISGNTSSHWVKSNSSVSHWPTLTWVWTSWCSRGTSLHLSSQDKRQAELLSCRQNCINLQGTFHYDPNDTFHWLNPNYICSFNLPEIAHNVNHACDLTYEAKANIEVNRQIRMKIYRIKNIFLLGSNQNVKEMCKNSVLK